LLDFRPSRPGRARIVSDEQDETGHMRKSIGLSVVIAFSCALAHAETRAQAMQDPMRPPEASIGMASAAVGTGLQAVITSPTRKLAVIDGVVVPLGGSVREARLSGVSDSLAVLDKDGERDVLLMHPNIDKKPARRSPSR
jgi:hypothetical protein